VKCGLRYHTIRKFQKTLLRVRIVEVVKPATALVRQNIFERHARLCANVVVGAKIIVAQKFIDKLAPFAAKGFVIGGNARVRANFSAVMAMHLSSVRNLSRFDLLRSMWYSGDCSHILMPRNKVRRKFCLFYVQNFSTLYALLCWLHTARKKGLRRIPYRVPLSRLKLKEYLILK
jgi:hypothetical protein